VQHVVEVHADIGGDTERLARIALPALHVPLATAGDVGQLDIVFMAGLFAGDFFLQVENGLVVTQLQNIEEALAGFSLNQRQFI